MDILDERFLMSPWEYYIIISPTIYVFHVLNFLCGTWPSNFKYDMPREFPPMTRAEIDSFMTETQDTHTQIAANLIVIFSDTAWLNDTDPHRIPGTVTEMPNWSTQDHLYCSLCVWKFGPPNGYDILPADFTESSNTSGQETWGDGTDADSTSNITSDAEE
jgi:hypothetical protein